VRGRLVGTNRKQPNNRIVGLTGGYLETGFKSQARVDPHLFVGRPLVETLILFDSGGPS
jgi:hypothetical protein